MAYLGSGTAGDPYQIWTAADLNDIRNEVAFYHYKLMTDLDLSAYSSWIAIDNDGYNSFLSFDGNNKTISNLTITSASIGSNNALSLFGRVDGSGSENLYIKDLTILNANISIIGADFSALLNDINLSAVCTEFNDAGLGVNPTLSNIKIIGYTSSVINSTFNNIDVFQCGIMNRTTDVVTSSLCIISASQFINSGNIGIAYAWINGLINESTTQTYIHSCSVMKSELHLETPITVGYVNGLIGGAYGAGEIAYSSVKDCTLTLLASSTTVAWLSGFTLYSDAPMNDSYVFNCIISGSGSSGTTMNVTGFTSYAGSSTNVYVSSEFSSSDYSKMYYIAPSDVGIVTSYFESQSNFITTQSTATVLSAAEMVLSESFVGFDFSGVWLSAPISQSGYPYLSWETVDYTPTGDTSSLTLTSPVGGETYNANLGDIIPVSWSYT